MKYPALPLPLVALAPLALAACGANEADNDGADEVESEPSVAAPRTLVAADFDPDTLGAKIVGPQGPEPEAAIMADGREIGQIKSFVACPEGAEECVPGEMPEGTIYTYVHEVTLSGDIEPAEPQEVSEGAPAETPAALFRMTREGTGFNRSVGYSQGEAEAALGAADAITVTSDAGQIIWRATKGSGWTPGEAITFWWQSTVPPEGPADAYSLEVHGTTATAKGPFPPAEVGSS